MISHNGKKLLIAIMYILSHSITCMEIQQSYIPTLHELAFKAAKPELNEKIESITTRIDSHRNKLIEINNLMTISPLISDFAIEHEKTQSLINEVAYNHYMTIENRENIIFNDECLGDLNTPINAHAQSNFLKNEYQHIPCVKNSNTKALCIMGNEIILAPLDQILTALSLQSAETINAYNTIIAEFENTLHKQGIETAEQIIADKVKANSSFDWNRINYRFCYYVYPEPKKYSNSSTLNGFDCFNEEGHNLLNKIDICCSYDKKWLAKKDYISLTVCNAKNEPVCTLPPLNINQMCFSRNSACLFLTNNQGCFCLNYINNSIIKHYQVPGIKAICSLQDQEALVVVEDNNHFELWSLNQDTRTLLYSHRLNHNNHITTACFSNSGTQIALGFSDGTIALADRETGAIIATLPSKTNNTPIAHNKMEYSANDSILIVNVNTKQVCLWHIASQTCIKQINLSSMQPVTALTILQQTNNNQIIYTETNNYLITIPLIILNVPVTNENISIVTEINNIDFDWIKNTSITQLMNSCIQEKEQAKKTKLEEQMRLEEHKRKEIERKKQEDEKKLFLKQEKEKQLKLEQEKQDTLYKQKIYTIAKRALIIATPAALIGILILYMKNMLPLTNQASTA